MEDLIQGIYTAVVNGNASGVKQKIQAALDNGVPVEELLNKGLIAAMKEVGQLFEEGEYFVPEMLISARAMQSGMVILRPILVEQDIKPIGKVVIGTVKGDLHDIGKNLVSMMLEGAGFQIVDLGTDVAPEKFLEAINTHQPDIVGMSALLTTTMTNIEKTLRYFEENEVRNGFKVIIGGAPVTQKYADEIGADGFAPDASQAAVVSKHLMGVA
ncbi:MAG: methyltransferase cognate corrinoid protein [Chloroflexi bacterium]|nr:MAG: methyltransferase cognate corrinoid protein [Chloroflexota bacterium]MBA4375624.1 cobalamin-binding protein [Anaerolinea sp.]